MTPMGRCWTVVMVVSVLIPCVVAQVQAEGVAVKKKPPATQPSPAPLVRVRCVKSRGDLIRHSDIVSMKSPEDVGTLQKYCIDVVAWGMQVSVQADRAVIAKRREQMDKARKAGVRFQAVDCALVQETGRCVVAGGDRTSPNLQLYYPLRNKDRNEAVLNQIAASGVDLKRSNVLDVHGDWVGVPWLQKRYRIPYGSNYSPTVRRWMFEQMDLLASLNPTALHFDEPGSGAYGLQADNPGDFSDQAMTAFREWLGKQPEKLWREAGVRSLDGFNYREFVLAHGGDPRKAPLWREFVRFQLFTTVEFVRELRDRVRAKVGKDIPFSMNANPGSWIKLPFLQLQDFMTTEVPHEARSRKPPVSPLLVYKLGDAFRQPVASTAHGNDWYEMKADEQPMLVCSWLAMSYALGHHFMIPFWAWVMDPVKGSDSYVARTEHYMCFAHFVKKMARLLDGYEAVSAVGVVVGCDAIERDEQGLRALCRRLADEQIPFGLAVEGNDLLDRQVTAADLEGYSAVILANPSLLSDQAKQRVGKLAGDRPVVEPGKGPLPGALPRPIRVEGNSHVWVLPRAIPGKATAPVVLHLLNRDYDPARRDMAATGRFRISLDKRLFGGAAFSRARLYQPRLLEKLPHDDAVVTSTPLHLAGSKDAIEITVPDVKLWGIVELLP